MTRRDKRTRKQIPVRVSLFQLCWMNVEYENEMRYVCVMCGRSVSYRQGTFMDRTRTRGGSRKLQVESGKCRLFSI